MKKFITVSFNPAIDRTMLFDRFVPGTLNRTDSVSVTAGSKGTNVARAIHRMGGDVVSISFSGGSTGDFLESEMKKEGIPAEFVRTAAGVRENIKLIDSAGVGTEANEAGGPYSSAEVEKLISLILEKADENAVFCLCGSIPRGVEKSVYKWITEKVRSKGATVALDCDGEALTEGLSASPDFIKPNQRELSGLLGREISMASAPEAALEAAKKYGVTVLCTLGEEGSVYADPTGCAYRASAPKNLEVKGFAGAGDTYLAVFLYKYLGLCEPLPDSLRAASSAAAAKITVHGSGLPDDIFRYVPEIRAEKIHAERGCKAYHIRRLSEKWKR